LGLKREKDWDCGALFCHKESLGGRLCRECPLEEVSQNVFITLAKKAGSLKAENGIGGVLLLATAGAG
jgi:hypothetical protein|tara:strand:- start:241 stop:444 length:204 start_codon:yes stop_codon:yes gene_type:complete